MNYLEFKEKNPEIEKSTSFSNGEESPETWSECNQGRDFSSGVEYSKFIRCRKTDDSEDRKSYQLKRTITEISLRKKHLSTVNMHRENLTEYECSEIILYREIYFVGTIKKLETSTFTDADGYYIAVIGDHLVYRYEILQLLGEGTFGKVYKCMDHKLNLHVAIKATRNSEDFREFGFSELKIFEKLKKGNQPRYNFIVEKLDDFEFRGHLFVVLELLGNNLHQLLQKSEFKGLNLEFVRRIAQQTLHGLSFLHSKGIIHCDLKPDNIVITSNKNRDIKILDLGSSFEESRIHTDYVQSRYYRAPEVVIEKGYNKMIDVWSLGCIVVELILGKPLFQADCELELFQKFIEVIGLPDKAYIAKGRRCKIFIDRFGRFKSKGVPFSQSIESQFGYNQNLANFIKSCLTWKPEDRIQVQDALNHPWITATV